MTEKLKDNKLYVCNETITMTASDHYHINTNSPFLKVIIPKGTVFQILNIKEDMYTIDTLSVGDTTHIIYQHDINHAMLIGVGNFIDLPKDDLDKHFSLYPIPE